MKNTSLISLVSLFILLAHFSCSDQEKKIDQKQSPKEVSKHKQSALKFELLSPSKTGVKFVNKMVESNGFNYMLWERMYNGSGVATGDFNNDGLADIFVTGNIMSNRIYLNKGNLQFEDVTKSAGFKPDGLWSFGVTLGDVNSDGYLDIYIFVETVIK